MRDWLVPFHVFDLCADGEVVRSGVADSIFEGAGLRCDSQVHDYPAREGALVSGGDWVYLLGLIFVSQSAVKAGVDCLSIDGFECIPYSIAVLPQDLTSSSE